MFSRWLFTEGSIYLKKISVSSQVELSQVVFSPVSAGTCILQP
jgi:hypothetical protein